jgi:hypothetical protein
LYIHVTKYPSYSSTLLQTVYTEGNFLPDLSTDDKGANWWDRDEQLLWFVLGGGDPVDIVTSANIIVTFNVPTQTVDEFFSVDRIAENFALFFDIPASKVKVVKAVREGGRKKRDAGVDVSGGHFLVDFCFLTDLCYSPHDSTGVMLNQYSMVA